MTHHHPPTCSWVDCENPRLPTPALLVDELPDGCTESPTGDVGVHALRPNLTSAEHCLVSDDRLLERDIVPDAPPVEEPPPVDERV